MRIEYHLLEVAGILIFLASGGFLVYDSLAQPGLPIEVLGGSVLLVLGGVSAAALAKALFRHFQQDPNHE